MIDAGRTLRLGFVGIWSLVAVAALVLGALGDSAWAQGRLLDVQIEKLAVDTLPKLRKHLRERAGEDFPVYVLPAEDADLSVRCQPLGGEVQSQFRQRLLDRIHYDQETEVEVMERQELVEGSVAILLKWRRPAEGVLRISSLVGKITRTSATMDSGGEVDVDIASLSEDARACLDDRPVFAVCEAPNNLSLRDSPRPHLAKSRRTLSQGTQFEVLAAFDDGGALLVSHAADTALGNAREEIRAFLAGGVRLLERWADRGTCWQVDLGEFEPAEREVWSAGQTLPKCAVCPAMVVLPEGGDVYLGSPDGEIGRQPDEEARRGVQPIRLEIAYRLAVSATEITHSHWQPCMADGACPRPDRDANPTPRPDMPVAVSFEEARTYIAWLNARKEGHDYRLPTEAEWEYAARGGAETRYPWGDVMRPGMAVCRNCGLAGGIPDGPQPVPDTAALVRPGMPRVNGYGLFDMHGNLWEWVSDCYAPRHAAESRTGAPYRPPGDPDCRDTPRVVKGGSFRDDALALRSGNRFYASPDTNHRAIGFRVVRRQGGVPWRQARTD